MSNRRPARCGCVFLLGAVLAVSLPATVSGAEYAVDSTESVKIRRPWGLSLSYHLVPGNDRQEWRRTSIGDIQTHVPTHVVTAHLWWETGNYKGLISGKVLYGLRLFHGRGRRQIQSLYGYDAFSSSSITGVGALWGYGCDVSFLDKWVISADATMGALYFGWIRSSLAVDIDRRGHEIRLYDYDRGRLGYMEYGLCGGVGYRVKDDYLIALKAGYDLRVGTSASSLYAPMRSGTPLSFFDGLGFGIEIEKPLGMVTWKK